MSNKNANVARGCRCWSHIYAFVKRSPRGLYAFASRGTRISSNKRLYLVKGVSIHTLIVVAEPVTFNVSGSLIF
jgi:hypothetical protein